MASLGPTTMVGIPANVATEDVRIVVERPAGNCTHDLVLRRRLEALRVVAAGCVEVMSSA
jgi:hypothetical protein